MDLFKFKNKCGEEQGCPNTQGKYGTYVMYFTEGVFYGIV